jgi:hypothetical protein
MAVLRILYRTREAEVGLKVADDNLVGGFIVRLLALNKFTSESNK